MYNQELLQHDSYYLLLKLFCLKLVSFHILEYTMVTYFETLDLQPEQNVINQKLFRLFFNAQELYKVSTGVVVLQRSTE